MYFKMTEDKFKSLPLRSEIKGLPLIGKEYRDDVCVYVAANFSSDPNNWDKYTWACLKPTIIDGGNSE